MDIMMASVKRAASALLSCIFLASAAAARPPDVPSSPPVNTAELVPTASNSTSSRSSGRYYIEFRVAEIGTYGHSYVAHGRLNDRGKPADAHYADLHPVGNYIVMAVGHVLPVPANTEWDPDVLKLPIVSSYFHTLSAAEYARLQTALQKAHADKQPYWNALSHNCNHFVAELARTVGLRTPTDLQIAYTFIPALRNMNEGGQTGATGGKTAVAR